MTIQYGPEGQYKQAVGTQLRVTTTVYERWPLNRSENDINRGEKNRGFENRPICNNTGSSVVLPLRGFDKSIQYTSTEHADNNLSDLLLICDICITLSAKTDWIFKAHDWIRRFVVAALVTHRSTTFPTMMLKKKTKQYFFFSYIFPISLKLNSLYYVGPQLSRQKK